MAAKYEQIVPLWLDQESHGQRSDESAKRYTVDVPATAYQSRSDNPPAKRPT
jgi:hypothetical protein